MGDGKKELLRRIEKLHGESCETAADTARTTSPHTEISCEISGCSCVVFACTKFCVLQAVLERSKHPASCVVLTDLEFLPMELVVVASTSSST